MIRLELGELAAAGAAAVLRPVGADGVAASAAARRLEVAAGPEVEGALLRMGELPVGSAVVTGAGALAADLLVHVVVRSAEEPVTAGVVRRALENGLRRVEEWRLDSVALPPLGTGAGNLDAEEAAEVMIPLLLSRLREQERPPRITLVCERDYELDAFRRTLAAHAAPAAPR